MLTLTSQITKLIMASEILAPGAANIIQDEINELEKRLQDAKARLYKAQSSPPPLTPNRKRPSSSHR